MDPDEGCCGRSIDAGAVEVTTCCSDDATNKEANDDGCGLHDRGTETFADDDRNED